MSFNDDDAMEFVSSIHELNDHRFENLVTKEFLSEKIHRIDQRFTRLESNIDQRFTTSQASNNLQFNEIKTSFSSKISETKSELIKEHPNNFVNNTFIKKTDRMLLKKQMNKFTRL
jgi:hypothetical protein